MQLNKFEDLRKEIQELYRIGDYPTALDLVETNIPDFPDQKHFLLYWRLTLSSQLGDVVTAISTLQEMVDDGYWMNESLLRIPSSLELLQGVEGFETLVQLNNELRNIDQSSLYPILISRPEGECTSEENPCHLLFGFHANASMAQDSLAFWVSAAKQGWLVAAPQSFQAMWKGAYTWDDRQTAASEINEHLSSLAHNYQIDEGKTVASGLVGGAETALYFALRRVIGSIGFILINPQPSISSILEECISPNVDYSISGLKGYFIYGELVDNNAKDGIKKQITTLNELGIICVSEEVPNAGYAYESGYSTSLLNGLNYLTGD
jgi:uncharacterized protein Usg